VTSSFSLTVMVALSVAGEAPLAYGSHVQVLFSGSQSSEERGR